jgi:hypothetical protein
VLGEICESNGQASGGKKDVTAILSDRRRRE